jgi:hypothetical protein
MGSDSQALQQARKLIGQRDFDGAIDLLSPIDDPSFPEARVERKSFPFSVPTDGHGPLRVLAGRGCKRGRASTT